MRNTPLNLIRAVAPFAIVATLAGCNTPVAEPEVAAAAFTAELKCGQLPISVDGRGEQLTLHAADQQLTLQQAISASGARYVGEDETQTSLWFKGEQAALVWQGMEYPQCAPAGAVVEPFRASGNEPFWSLTLEQGSLTLHRLNEGELPAQDYIAADTQGEYVSQGDPRIRLRLTDELCRDDMSGMPHPQRASVEVDGTTLTGCGGDPARLLQGAEWVVEDINAGGIIDRSRVTLNFWQDGRITGRASCNNLMGQYQLSGEGLSIGQVATTRMACAPALLEQEQRVLGNLAQVQRFDVDETGALLLHSAEGSLKARLEYRE